MIIYDDNYIQNDEGISGFFDNALKSISQATTKIYRTVNPFVSQDGSKVGTEVLFNRMGIPQVGDIQIKSTGDILPAFEKARNIIISASIEQSGMVSPMMMSNIVLLKSKVKEYKDKLINDLLNEYNKRINDIKNVLDKIKKYKNQINIIKFPYENELVKILPVKEYLNNVKKYEENLNELEKKCISIISYNIKEIIDNAYIERITDDIYEYYSKSFSLEGTVPTDLLKQVDIMNENIKKQFKNLYENMDALKNSSKNIELSYNNLYKTKMSLINYIKTNYNINETEIIKNGIKIKTIEINEKNDIEKMRDEIIKKENEKAGMIGTGLIILNLLNF